MNNLIFSRNIENSSYTNSTNKKIDIKKLKNNTLNSLYEVECFLTKINEFKKCIKFYKVLK